MWQPLWARPNDNCQLWPKWQSVVPFWSRLAIARLAAAIWPLSWLRIQCLNVQLPEWPQLAIASLGPEWPKSAVYRPISLKIGYFELSHGHDITVTSHLGHWYLFQYVWKEETPSYTMVEFTCIGGFHFFKFTMGGKPPPWAPLGRRATKKAW